MHPSQVLIYHFWWDFTVILLNVDQLQLLDLSISQGFRYKSEVDHDPAGASAIPQMCIQLVRDCSSVSCVQKSFGHLVLFSHM